MPSKFTEKDLEVTYFSNSLCTFSLTHSLTYSIRVTLIGYLVRRSSDPEAIREVRAGRKLRKAVVRTCEMSSWEKYVSYYALVAEDRFWDFSEPKP